MRFAWQEHLFNVYQHCVYQSVFPFLMQILVNKERNRLAHTDPVQSVRRSRFTRGTGAVGLTAFAERFTKCNKEFPFHASNERNSRKFEQLTLYMHTLC